MSNPFNVDPWDPLSSYLWAEKTLTLTMIFSSMLGEGDEDEEVQKYTLPFSPINSDF